MLLLSRILKILQFLAFFCISAVRESSKFWDTLSSFNEVFNGAKKQKKIFLLQILNRLLSISQNKIQIQHSAVERVTVSNFLKQLSAFTYYVFTPKRESKEMVMAKLTKMEK